MARFLIVLGTVFVLVGILLMIFPKTSFFRLPGDIIFKKDNFVLVLPITTGLFLSIILTIILNIILRR